MAFMDINLRNFSQPLHATKTFEAQKRIGCPNLEICSKVFSPLITCYHTSKGNFIKYMSCNNNQKKIIDISHGIKKRMGDNQNIFIDKKEKNN